MNAGIALQMKLRDGCVWLAVAHFTCVDGAR
jgi:hypothetical protein